LGKLLSCLRGLLHLKIYHRVKVIGLEMDSKLLVLISARCRGSFFYIKNIKKNKNLKILGFSVKLYPRILDLAATPDLRVIFIILIIKLNLYDPSLSKSGCNT